MSVALYLPRVRSSDLLGIGWTASFERSLHFRRGFRRHAPSHFARAAGYRALHPPFGGWTSVAEQSVRVERMATLLAQFVLARSAGGCLRHDMPEA